jgi:hypothetical protein
MECKYGGVGRTIRTQHPHTILKNLFRNLDD